MLEWCIRTGSFEMCFVLIVFVVNGQGCAATSIPCRQPSVTESARHHGVCSAVQLRASFITRVHFCPSFPPLHSHVLVSHYSGLATGVRTEGVNALQLLH